MDRTFQRGMLFSVLGALLFFIIGYVLCGIFPSLNGTFLFRIHALALDLKVIMVEIRFNIVALIGFTVGLALYLFDFRVGSRKKR